MDHLIYCRRQVDTGSPVSTPATSPDTDGSTPVYLCQSPSCPEQFSRWQDRDRHLLKHLPHWIHCPLLDCQWRGNRRNVFLKHWEAKHSRHSGDTPGSSEFTIYDPKVFIDSIRNRTISVHETAEIALYLVYAKANQLQKLSLLINPWGRRSN